MPLISSEATAIADKDLPDIKPADIKLDTSKVDALKPAELEAVKQKWVAPSRSNDQLLLLLEQCPAKIDRINAILATQKEPDQGLIDKIARLKEQYAVCVKEVQSRKTMAIAVAEPVEELKVK